MNSLQNPSAYRPIARTVRPLMLCLVLALSACSEIPAGGTSVYYGDDPGYYGDWGYGGHRWGDRGYRWDHGAGGHDHGGHGAGHGGGGGRR